MVQIMKKKYDQDVFLNLCCDPLGYFAKDELNPWVRCAFGNVFVLRASNILGMELLNMAWPTHIQNTYIYILYTISPVM